MRKPILLFLGICLCGLFTACPPVADEKAHFICFGDSVTAGIQSGSYPMYLEQLLISKAGEKAGSVVNRGQIGEVVCQSEGRLRENINKTTYPNAHTVLFWEGGNDVFNYIYQNNTDISRRIAESPTDQQAIADIANICVNRAIQIIRENNQNVIIGTYFYCVAGEDKPATGYPKGFSDIQARNANEYIEYFNKNIIALGNANGIKVAQIDKLAVLGGSKNNYADAIHPNENGYRMIAQVWFDTIVN